MPDETKARFFELAAFRPPFESLLYALALTLPAAAAISATLGRYFALPLVAVGCSIGLWLRWMSSIHSTLIMGVDGFSICRRAKERFVPWTDFLRFEKGPRGIVALSSNGWVSLGRSRVISDTAMTPTTSRTQNGRDPQAARRSRETLASTASKATHPATP